MLSGEIALKNSHYNNYYYSTFHDHNTNMNCFICKINASKWRECILFSKTIFCNIIINKNLFIIPIIATFMKMKKITNRNINEHNNNTINRNNNTKIIILSTILMLQIVILIIVAIIIVIITFMVKITIIAFTKC